MPVFNALRAITSSTGIAARRTSEAYAIAFSVRLNNERNIFSFIAFCGILLDSLAVFAADRGKRFFPHKHRILWQIPSPRDLPHPAERRVLRARAFSWCRWRYAPGHWFR